MDKISYDKLYKNITISLHKSYLASKFHFNTMKDFPNNISDDVKWPMVDALDYYLKEYEIFSQGKNPEELWKRSKRVIEWDFYLHPFHAIQKLSNNTDMWDKNIMTMNNEKLLIQNINFDSIIIEQQLVFMLGLIEGFIFDSVKTIYYNNDKYILKNPKGKNPDQLSGQEKLDMINNLNSRKWSMWWFSSRFDKLNHTFDINLWFKKELINIFDEANLMRNCILHNCSKITQNYYKIFWKHRNLDIGDNLEINEYFLESIYYISLDLIRILYLEVNAKWFNNDNIKYELGWNYYKDFMNKKWNWLYERLNEKGVFI